MKRERIDFATFKEHFIQQPDGYFSVYADFAEDYEGEYLKVLHLDMICEWRLSDGKAKFVEVPFDTAEQHAELIEYLRVTAKMLNEAIITRINELEPFDKLKPESDAVPYPDDGLPRLTDEQIESTRKQAIQYEMRLIYQAIQNK